MTEIARKQDYQSPYLPENNTLSQSDTLLSAWFSERASIAGALKSASEALNKEPKTQDYLTINVDSTIKRVDASLWDKTIQRTDVLNAMSSKRSKQWQELIEKKETPPFTPEQVIPTLNMLFQQSGLHFAERVASVFEALSPQHVTNSPMGFRERLILADVMDAKVQTLYSEKTALIDDLRVLTAIVLKRHPALKGAAETFSALHGIVLSQQFGEWLSFDGGALSLKLFKKGTVHIQLHEDVAYKMNDILSMLYPHAIADHFRQPPRKKRQCTKPIEKTLSLDVLNDLSRLKRFGISRISELQEKYPLHEAVFILDPKKVKAAAETHNALGQLGGTPIDDVAWSFSYDVTKVIPHVLREGRLPDVKSHQYYPSKGGIGARLVDELKAEINVLSPLILEPSAGQGHLISRWTEAQWRAVEISSVNVAVLKAQGVGVVQADFLDTPKEDTYDGVAMNPPFHYGQAAEHVLHAIDFLKPGGVLKSIFPASEEQLTHLKRHASEGVDITTSELIKNAFENVSVDVVVLTVKKQD